MNNPTQDPDLPRMTRRSFLQIAGQTAAGLAGLLGLGGIIRFLGAPGVDTPRSIFNLGRVADYLDQPQTLVPEASAMILNSGDQLRAISTVCPHLGCQVTATAEGFTCPCHGSKFDAAGRTDKRPRPAPTSLRSNLIKHLREI